MRLKLRPMIHHEPFKVDLILLKSNIKEHDETDQIGTISTMKKNNYWQAILSDSTVDIRSSFLP